MVTTVFLNRVAIIAAALFIGTASLSDADISMNGLIEHISGLSDLPGGIISSLSRKEHPAHLGEIKGSYIEFDAVRQEDIRSLRGSRKQIGQGRAVISCKREILPERAGVYIGYFGFSSSLSWPFSRERVRLNEDYNSGVASMSGYVSGERCQGGITVGRELFGENGGFLGTGEIQGKLPYGIRGSARYSTKPVEWDAAIDFQDMEKVLPSQLRADQFESILSAPLGRIGDIGVNYRRVGVSTPAGFRAKPNGHIQVWEAECSDWQVQYLKSIPGMKGGILYGEGRLTGEIGLLYNGASYMQGKGDGPVKRFRFEVSPERLSSSIPAVRYDRVVTDLSLSHGIFVSWPFTPRQIEIIGDKTWTFSGKSRIACNSGTLAWERFPQTLITLSYTRAYLDYRLRITTRDHLSLDPWDMLFGRMRTETDNTRYFDFAGITFVKKKSFQHYMFEAAIRQFIPLYHARKAAQGNAPEPPSFPRLQFKSPESIGGLTIGLSVRYTL